MKEADLEVSVEYIKTVFEAKNEDRAKYGLQAVDATDQLLKAFAEQMIGMYEDGYHMGSKNTRTLWKEVVYDSIREEVQKHPKMSLKTFAKKHGIIKEEEEPN